MRRYVFGDNAHRGTRYVMSPTGPLVCIGLRYRYRRLKRMIELGEHTVQSIIKGKVV